MKLALISCMIFSREVNYLIATSDNIIHSFWLEKNLHDYPEELQSNIQSTIHLIEAINERNIENKPFDAIVLGYGLCSNGTVGLTSNTLPLIIPKCVDCMALFLGSNQKYTYLTYSYKNIFWYNKAWIENSFVPSTETQEVEENPISVGETIDDILDAELEAMKNQKHAIFIKSKLFDDKYEQSFIEKTAKYFNWEFIKLDGDMSYFSALLSGKWDDRLFLTCPPGYETKLDKKKNVLMAEKIVTEEERQEAERQEAEQKAKREKEAKLEAKSKVPEKFKNKILF